MDTTFENWIRCILRFGFPPDFDRAESYLRDLLLPAAALAPQGHRPMHDVLEEVVSGIIETAGTERIVIPLSEGLDSRAILAAALRTTDKRRLICVTFGRQSHPDVVGARTVCAALGIEWRWIDVGTIDWNVSEMVLGVGSAYQRLRSYASQAVVRLQHVEREIGRDAFYLSGYFGDAITGGHLANKELNGRRSVDAFLIKNATQLVSVTYDVEGLAGALLGYAERMHKALGGVWNVTESDLLDWGFRQGMRIKGSVCAYDRVAMPFEDPRWIRYWLDQPLSERLSQLRYKRELRARYPDVFMLERDQHLQPAQQRRLRQPMQRKLRLFLKNQSIHFSLDTRLRANMAASRGRMAPELLRDFQVNPTARDAYVALMETFDRRGIVPEVNFSAKVATARATPTLNNVDYFAQAARVEAHLRAGTLGSFATELNLGEPHAL